MKLHVGTSGFAYKEWKGAFYPPDLPADDMLAFYASRFGAVEINNTFYRMPRPGVLKSWSAEVPESFSFAFKAPQQITHFRRLNDCAQPVSHLLKALGVMKGRLGPLLFGLPPNFKTDVPRLRAFLKLLPKTQRVAFEFRNQSRFDEEVFAALEERNVALCLADAEDEPNAPFRSTADWGYIRRRRDNYSAPELRKWAERLARQPWREAYVFFKHEDEARGPAMAEKLRNLAGRRVTSSPPTRAGGGPSARTPRRRSRT